MAQIREINTFPKASKFTPYDKNNFDFELLKRNKAHLSRDNLKVCKVIILGDLCVGKTSLLNRFCHKIFDSSYRTTIGVDFHSEQINILGIPYYLQIWDTAGQERFKCIAQCYYRKAHVIMLVFDLSTIRTLANCKHWLHDALEVCKDNAPFIFLVGSKKDLLSQEGYNSVEKIALASAKTLNAEFWSVSSKTGENIDELFVRAAALSFKRHINITGTENINNNSKKIGTELICVEKKRRGDDRHTGCGSKCAKA
ncbi:ras-related protein Rab-36 [Tribolium castaneum]|uniref:Ras-related protein Rab-36 n=1 Tax=Tribolium castaneum TaxID=7070 RepID=D6X2B0_TRICA|nr:PREDICTED: ras-related protein Rab-34 [Tribolium castaneum]EFA10238.2 Ras-related protein Rab6-like Protein [Tribolium castaneum]|eukprot:XP_001810854.1 PREDICTED: ras-related protein Rab-34 [Tribolium castaneum]